LIQEITGYVLLVFACDERFAFAWNGMEWSGLVWTDMDCSGLLRTNWTGSNGLDGMDMDSFA